MKQKDTEALWLLCDQFNFMLNLTDEADLGILEVIKLFAEDSDTDRSGEFSDPVALLLKHDWERAKRKARSQSSAVAPEGTTDTLKNYERASLHERS